MEKNKVDLQIMGKPGEKLPEWVTRPSLVKSRVYMGLPTYDERVHQSAVTLKRTASCVIGRVQTLHIESSSLLARTFNKLYAAALNARADGITHFCLIHEDVHPLEPGWLDKMLGIMDTAGADVLSAVVPLKSEEGLTSTAMDMFEAPGGGFSRIKRFTMSEIWSMDVDSFTTKGLLLNTGLMLIDLRKPWVEGMWFEMIDSISRAPDGKFYAHGISEDWDFSRKAEQAGASLWATRAIPLVHRGRGEFKNDHAWGTILTEK